MPAMTWAANRDAQPFGEHDVHVEPPADGQDQPIWMGSISLNIDHTSSNLHMNYSCAVLVTLVIIMSDD